MGIILALAAAVSWGTGDFLGGTATRRESVFTVAATTYLIGGIFLTLVALPAGGSPTAGDLWLGALGGLAGLGGIVLLYHGLARGPMTVVAPVTGVVAAALPLLWGLAGGERLGGVALTGIATGLVAIVAISAVPDPAGPGTGTDGSPPRWKSALTALAAGVGFGAFYIVLGRTSADSGMWPLVASRGIAVVAMIPVTAAVGTGFLPRTTGLTIAAAGLFDSGANALYLLATRHGSVTVAALLASLYPAATVILARAVHREHLSAVQRGGLGLAALAVILISLG